MSVTVQTILDDFGDYISDCVGPADTYISGITAIETATAEDLSFVSEARFLAPALAGESGVLIITPGMRDQVQACNKTLLLSKTPQLAMAKIAIKYFEKPLIENVVTPFVHPTALIHPSAKIGAQVYIGAQSIVEKDAVIGNGVYIGPQVVIEARVKIGESTEIYPQCFIGADTKVGKNCGLQPQAVIGAWDFDLVKRHSLGPLQASSPKGSVTLEDRVDVGAQCTISKGHQGLTLIQAGTKLDNHCLIAAGVKIGKNCLLTAGAHLQAHSQLGNFCVLGGNSSILKAVKLADQIQLAGMSVVTDDITKPGTYGGHPLVPVKDYFKRLAMLKQLPRLRKIWGEQQGRASTDSTDQ